MKRKFIKDEYDDMPWTIHSTERAKARHIPPALIVEAIERGHKTVNVDREAYEYKLKNILGMRGTNLIVIQGFDGRILTCYLEKIPQRATNK